MKIKIKNYQWLKISSFILLFQSFFLHSKPFNYYLNISTEIMPPYNFYNQQNDIVGINIDVVKSILAKTNIHADFNIFPWKRSYQMALNYSYTGVMSTARTAKREHLFKWVGPLASGKSFLYKLKSRKDINVSSIDDAKNYIIAVVRGDVFQEVFEKLGFKLNENIMLFSDHSEYIKPFLAGKVDLILGSSFSLPYILSANGSDINRVTSVVKIPDSKGNYLALNKDVPNAVVNKLNKALEGIKVSNEYNIIVDKYLNKKINHGLQ